MILLALLHGLVALSADSLAVIAELAHNIVDLLMAVAVLIGLKLAGREAKSLPDVFYKTENRVVAAALAITILKEIPHRGKI